MKSVRNLKFCVIDFHPSSEPSAASVVEFFR